LLLAARGFYDGVAFHRSIRNFMLQGGDPSGTGRGGESAWGRPFADEFVQSLSHSGRGVVAMANAGAHSNGSQFYILYKSAPHLDKKHTVFGRVVGGMDTTLSALERVPTDADDRPTEEIRIKSITVFDDPFGAHCGACIGFSVCCITDTLWRLAADPEPAPAGKQEAEEPAEEEEGLWWSNPAGARHGLVPQHGGVGKFLPALAKEDASAPAKRQKTAPTSGGGFGNFSGW
jgi:peptidyl-prolyl cis-trans isomerase-like protein 2